MHIAVFPWLAFGHMIPYLNLSKLLAQKGHKVSFISTPRNIDRLPKLPHVYASSISFVKIPLPKLEQLPEGAEATTDIRNHEMDYLKKAFDGLEPGLTRFLEDSNPDWIIYDSVPYWLPPIATRLGISRAFFCIINSWFLSFFGPPEVSKYRTKIEDFMVPPKWVKFETTVAFRRFEARWMVGAEHDTDSGVSDFFRGDKVITGCEAIFLRDCYEFQPDWLKALEELYKKPVIPVGLMPPDDSDSGNSEAWVSIKNWLDGHGKGSVVYVALGSEVNLSLDQITELAVGLELSGVDFIWVLRRATSESESMELPNGYEDRVRGRGIVWRSWAPQLKILSHESVGGFLTHCGWSSTVEGLAFGVPLITLPFLVDQGLNSRVVAEEQVGVEIQRNEHDGSYTSESVANSVKLVMLENAGKEYREKAKEISGLFGDKQLQHRYTDGFIKFLENHKTNSL